MSSSEHSAAFHPYLDAHREHAKFSVVGPLCAEHKRFSDPVIFVDGGSVRREGNEGLCVGDGDSSTIPMDIKLDPRKDLSDLSFALSLLPAKVKEIALDGFLGGRRDHELLNLGEVFHFLSCRHLPCAVFFDHEIVALTKGHWQLAIDGLFSLMTIETTCVNLSGKCEYQIDPPQEVAPLSSFGLSNIAKGEISIQTNNPIFVLSENILRVQPVD